MDVRGVQSKVVVHKPCSLDEQPHGFDVVRFIETGEGVRYGKRADAPKLLSSHAQPFATRSQMLQPTAVAQHRDGEVGGSTQEAFTAVDNEKSTAVSQVSRDCVGQSPTGLRLDAPCQ
jgi:hypothetical protein